VAASAAGSGFFFGGFGRVSFGALFLCRDGGCCFSCGASENSVSHRLKKKHGNKRNQEWNPKKLFPPNPLSFCFLILIFCLLFLCHFVAFPLFCPAHYTMPIFHFQPFLQNSITLPT